MQYCNPLIYSSRKTDFVSECVMQVLREEYRPEYRYYINEGMFDAKKLSESCVKVYNTVKKFATGAGFGKKLWSFISNKASFQLLPALISDGFKTLNPKFCKEVVFTAKAFNRAKDITIGNAIAVGSKVVQMEINHVKYFMTLDMKNVMAGLVDLLDSVIGIITTVAGFIPGYGTVIQAALNLVWATLKNLWGKFKSELDRIWAIVKDFVKGQFGIDIDAVKEAWGKFKNWAGEVGNACREWAKDFFNDPAGHVRGAVSYGGQTGVALKDALSKLKSARANLKNTKSEQLNVKIKYIACVYRNKRNVSQEEYDKTKNFCNTIMDLDIPTFQEARKKWPGIKNVDDGTYAYYILSDLPWNVLSGDKDVNSWFIKSCEIASMKFAELEEKYNKIRKPTGRGKVY